MSTRAQIKYKDSEFNIYIYKHCDGYPRGVLPTLVPFVEQFFKERGDDEAYFLAQCIRWFAREDERELVKEKSDPNSFYNKINKGKPNARHYTESMLGWGLDCVKHGDIEYLYEVDSAGSIYINGKKKTKAQLKKLAVSRE